MKSVINKLKQIKRICSQHEKCTYCPMYRGYQCTVFATLEELMECNPKHWDIDEVERIVY